MICHLQHGSIWRVLLLYIILYLFPHRNVCAVIYSKIANHFRNWIWTMCWKSACKLCNLIKPPKTMRSPNACAPRSVHIHISNRTLTTMHTNIFQSEMFVVVWLVTDSKSFFFGWNKFCFQTAISLFRWHALRWWWFLRYQYFTMAPIAASAPNNVL